MIDIHNLLPSLNDQSLVDFILKGDWHVEHGSMQRFPKFFQEGGQLSGIHNLADWKLFDVGYRNSQGKYIQMSGAGNPAMAFYEMGALVRSSNIDQTTSETRQWLSDWAELLGVRREDLRLNSWAIRGADGIDWHFDPEDVIHFQLRGEKKFKFLKTEFTKYADRYLKRFEKQIAVNQDFTEAEEVIVKPGTVTIIPRGVWHWSECLSPESFAVALCVCPPTCSERLAESIMLKLGENSEARKPLLGAAHLKEQAMSQCLQEMQRIFTSSPEFAAITGEVSL